MTPYIAAGALVVLVLGYIARRWGASQPFSPPEVLMLVGFTAAVTTTAASAGREFAGWISLAGTLAMLVGVIAMKFRPKLDHTTKRSP
ncbi:MAG: hypothetical protein ACR2GJ_08110 [Gemmatimonadaceae bacterium]